MTTEQKNDRADIIRKANSLIGRVSMYSNEVFRAMKADKGLMITPSFEVCGKFAYSNGKRFRYDVARRQRTTFQRIVRRQLKLSQDEIGSYALDQLADRIKRDIWLGSSVESCRGYDIPDMYVDMNESIGTCMTNDDELTYLYALNPDKVQLLYIQDMARSLLWLTDQDIYVLDRCYPCDKNQAEKDQLKVAAQSIADAEEKPLLCRDDFCSGYPNAGDHIINSRELSVSLERNSATLYPYMDTFCYCDDDSNNPILKNHPEGCEYILDDTGGDKSEYNCCKCYNCGDAISADDNYSFDGEVYCCECVDDISFVCEHCEARESHDNRITVDSCYDYCRRCVDNGIVDAYYCEKCGEYKSDSNTIDDESICDDCASDMDYICCEACCENKSDYTTVNGLHYCSDCTPEEEEEITIIIAKVTVA